MYRWHGGLSEMIKTDRFYTVKILTMETIRTEKNTPKTASTLTLIRVIP
jgi:hypothetical protein